MSVDIHTGVPQGSILGFLAIYSFLQYDITDVIVGAGKVKYAEDTVIYVADKDLKSVWQSLFFFEFHKEFQNKVRHLT